eukprot:8210902-Heterocapsa_arctica.AAC.1
MGKYRPGTRQEGRPAGGEGAPHQVVGGGQQQALARSVREKEDGRQARGAQEDPAARGRSWGGTRAGNDGGQEACKEAEA